MRVEMDFGHQWTKNYCFDLINVGFFRGSHMFSICFTLIGLYVDFDFIKEQEHVK